MPLSEHEQRLLDQLEQQLHSEDPKFVSAMGSAERRSPSARRLVVGVLVAVVGLLGLILAVSFRGPMSVVVGVLAFLVMLGGTVMASTRPRKRGPGGPVPGDGPSRGAAPAGRRPFMQRLEERWERRRGRP